MANRSAPVIEFVGLPGSGKTTIANSLFGFLQEARRPSISRTNVLRDNASFVSRQLRRGLLVLTELPYNIGAYGAVCRMIYKSRQSSFREYSKVAWNFWSVIAAVSHHRRKGVGIFVSDQGFAQAIWSVSFSAENPDRAVEAWRALSPYLGSEDVYFVVLDVPAELARSRLRNRTAMTSRLQENSTEADWSKAENIYLAILSELERNGHLIVRLEANDGTTPESVATHLFAILTSRLDRVDQKYALG